MEVSANLAPENVLRSPSCELARCTPIGPHRKLNVGSQRLKKKNMNRTSQKHSEPIRESTQRLTFKQTELSSALSQRSHSPICGLRNRRLKSGRGMLECLRPTSKSLSKLQESVLEQLVKCCRMSKQSALSAWWHAIEKTHRHLFLHVVISLTLRQTWNDRFNMQPSYRYCKVPANFVFYAVAWGRVWKHLAVAAGRAMVCVITQTPA